MVGSLRCSFKTVEMHECQRYILREGLSGEESPPPAHEKLIPHESNSVRTMCGISRTTQYKLEG